MPAYLGALTIVLMMTLVLTRVAMLRRRGITAFKFGELDKRDYVLPPFALLYFYLVFASAFGWPTLSTQRFFLSTAVAWGGVALCGFGLFFLAWALVSFRTSFRIGIDTDEPDKLITNGVFGLSRNPIYVAFFSILIGQFLIFPNWILALYFFGAVFMIHRQVLLEEGFLREHYGEAYTAYCRDTRRYL